MTTFFAALIALILGCVLGCALGFLFSRQKGQEALLTANKLAAEEKTALTAELAVARQREENFAQQIATKQEELKALQEQLKLWFENTATRVLKSTSEQSRDQLNTILTPMKERIEGFQKRVEEVYGKEAEQRISLKAQIEQLHAANKALSEDADALARALKGESQKRGAWGEMILENILATSGLHEGVDYILQGKGLELKSESGGHQKPDVIVNLSGGRQAIIDSKVSLVPYTKWASLPPDASDEDQALARRDMVESVKGHIKDLSGKKYQDNDKLTAHDYVFLFMPLESAMAAVLDMAPELTNFAWQRRVVLVSPTTLLLTLNIVHTALQLERQEQNAAEIAKDAGSLFNQIRLVVESLNEMDKHFTKAREAHQETLKRLATGRGNVLKRVEDFQAKGVQITKSIDPLRLEEKQFVDDLAEE